MPLVAGLFTHPFGSQVKDGQNRVRRRSAVTPRTVFDVVPRSRNRSVSGHFSNSDRSGLARLAFYFSCPLQQSTLRSTARVVMAYTVTAPVSRDLWGAIDIDDIEVNKFAWLLVRNSQLR